MKSVATNSLNRISLISFKTIADLPKGISLAGFYQHFGAELIKSACTRETMFRHARQLISIADLAYGVRRLDIAEHSSELLTKLPLPNNCEYIAQYYRALRLKRDGDIERARKQLEEVAEKAPLFFRARAMLSIGSIAQIESFEAAVPYRLEAHKISSIYTSDLLTLVEAQRSLAITRSVDEDYKGALKDLQQIHPLVNSISKYYPFLSPNHCNSIAVILVEAGQVQEAAQLSKIAIASPYASAYPEWLETADEIRSKIARRSKSFITISRADIQEEVSSQQSAQEEISLQQTTQEEVSSQQVTNVVTLTELLSLRDSIPSSQKEEPTSGKVLTPEVWKTSMVKYRKVDEHKDIRKHLGEITKEQKITEIVRLVSEGRAGGKLSDRIFGLFTPYDKQRRILDLVMNHEMSEEMLDKILEMLLEGL